MDVDAQRAAQGLNPLPNTPKEEPDDKPMCKHGCATMPCLHTRTEDKHKKHIGRELRGIPLVGSGPGVIDGTRPGDKVDRLEQSERDLQASRDLHDAMMRRARTNLRTEKP